MRPRPFAAPRWHRARHLRKCLRTKVTTAILPEDLDPDDITTPGRADDAGIDMPGSASGTEAWLRKIGIIK